MAALPYMQLYVADYLADTAHLSAAEHGAYLLLMFNYWQRGEAFKAKDERTLNVRLASVARMSNEEWAIARENIEEFFDVTPTEWRHERIERDLAAVNAKSNKASAAGKASGAKRSASVKAKAEDATNGRSTDVQQTLNHVDTEAERTTEADASVVGGDAANESAIRKTDRLPDCPQQEILALYAEILPDLPQPIAWEGARATNLRNRWRWVLAERLRKGKSCNREDGIDFFRRMFGYVAGNDFLSGRTSSWKGCDLGWLVKAENFAKVLAGNFDRKEAA